MRLDPTWPSPLAGCWTHPLGLIPPPPNSGLTIFISNKKMKTYMTNGLRETLEVCLDTTYFIEN